MERKAPAFFASPSELRAWFEQNHQTTQELWIGFYKTSSGQPSITWPESVDQALCFGWIDGVRRSIDDISYSIRFTPRKPHSIWSSVNIKRMSELIEPGLVQPAGLKAFNERDQKKSGRYSYEQRKTLKLDPARPGLLINDIVARGKVLRTLLRRSIAQRGVGRVWLVYLLRPRGYTHSL